MSEPELVRVRDVSGVTAELQQPAPVDQWRPTCQTGNTSVMYSYNLAYKDEPDDLMFPMEEDEVARRSGAFKSADCFCCSSSIPSAALVTGSLNRRRLNLFSILFTHEY